MKDGFTRKKVESLTLGEKLRKLREDFRMSLGEVSKATRIQVKYLEYLETGAYEKLPADVYVRGFLRSYARHLNVDEQALVKLYERERNIQENLGREVRKPVTTSFAPAKFVVTSRTFIFGFIGILLFGAFFYLYREFTSFASEPTLIILSPENSSIIFGDEGLVTGKTDRGAEVTINGQGVFVDGDGSFREKLVLQPGMNAITIRTLNRFQKEKTVMLSVEASYTPNVAQSLEAPILPEQSFQIEVAARLMPVMLSVKADGMVVFQGTLASEERKTFGAKESIEISSDHGEATFVRRDEEEAGPLSTTPGAVAGVMFLKSVPAPSTPE
ncbi:MAG: helix-turn-helix domain-containing protein [Candidatus Moranbacteria bacterium]|nr:helix-turn-helix domain-containing protein [Candidatus Moranbacteria bacterium]